MSLAMTASGRRTHTKASARILTSFSRTTPSGQPRRSHEESLDSRLSLTQFLSLVVTESSSCCLQTQTVQSMECCVRPHHSNPYSLSLSELLRQQEAKAVSEARPRKQNTAQQESEWEDVMGDIWPLGSAHSLDCLYCDNDACTGCQPATQSINQADYDVNGSSDHIYPPMDLFGDIDSDDNYQPLDYVSNLNFESGSRYSNNPTTEIERQRAEAREEKESFSHYSEEASISFRSFHFKNGRGTKLSNINTCKDF
jgi:hypothetical protein